MLPLTLSKASFTARAAALSMLAAWSLLSPAVARAEFPRPEGYVTDTAHLLDAAARQQLTTLLERTERDTSAEIALVTVTSLDGLSIEAYAQRLFADWGVGKKARDNGVLIVVAPAERTMRIEVGYGLEPVLPDGLAGEVIRTAFTPAFARGDYRGGITQGVERVAAIVRAQAIVSPDERRRLQDGASDAPPALLMIPFFGLFIGLGAFAVGLGLGSKTGFPLLWGALFGGIPMGMALVPFFNASIWILGPLAAAMGIWGFRQGRSASWRATLRAAATSGATAAETGGWMMGGGSSSDGGSSGSGSSSGSSFGGGSSGGGGASGRW